MLINQEWTGSSIGFGNSEREIKQLRATISQLRTEIAMIRAGTVPVVESSEASKHFENRGNQYHQRREKDLLCEIQELKAKQVTMQFNLDQARFVANRLSDRVKGLLQEVTDIARERDQIKIEKARLLNPAYIEFRKTVESTEKQPPKEQGQADDAGDIDDESKNENERTRVQTPNREFNQIIQGLQHTIAQLRLQLSETEDKLMWQKEAMSKLGRKGAKPVAWSEQTIAELGVSTSAGPKLDGVKTQTSEQAHEQLLMRAMRENIELREALDAEDSSLLEDPKALLNLGSKVVFLM